MFFIKLLRVIASGKRSFRIGDRVRFSHLRSIILRHRLEMTFLKELLGLLGNRVESALALFLAA